MGRVASLSVSNAVTHRLSMSIANGVCDNCVTSGRLYCSFSRFPRECLEMIHSIVCCCHCRYCPASTMG